MHDTNLPLGIAWCVNPDRARIEGECLSRSRHCSNCVRAGHDEQSTPIAGKPCVEPWEDAVRKNASEHEAHHRAGHYYRAHHDEIPITGEPATRQGQLE